MLVPAWAGQGLAMTIMCRKVPSGQPELPQPISATLQGRRSILCLGSCWAGLAPFTDVEVAPGHGDRVRVRVRAQVQHPCRPVGTHIPALLPLSWGPRTSECREGFTQPGDTTVCLVK